MKSTMFVMTALLLSACDAAKTPAEMTPAERESARVEAVRDQAGEVYEDADDKADRIDMKARVLGVQAARMANQADRIRADGRRAQEAIETKGGVPE